MTASSSSYSQGTSICERRRRVVAGSWIEAVEIVCILARLRSWTGRGGTL